MEAAVGATVGVFRFLAPDLPLLPAFETGTVIVDAEVTATVDAVLVVAVCDLDEPLPEEEEDKVDDDAARTYSVEVIVAALVVVGGLLLAESAAVALRAAAAVAVAVPEEAATTAGVDSEPFA